MATRVVKSAIWRYTDPDGVRRIARFGDVIEVDGDELKRGKALNVFNPDPIPAVASEAVDRALAAIESRTNEPPQVGGTLPVPPHDITGPGTDAADIEPTATGDAPTSGDVATTPTGDGGQDPQSDPDAATPPAEAAAAAGDELKRPAKAAHVEIWEAWAAKVRPDLTSAQIKAMTKDELQALAPKDG